MSQPGDVGFGCLAGLSCIGVGLLVGSLFTWNLDRHMDKPYGCGGCTYTQYIGGMVREVVDAAHHLW